MDAFDYDEADQGIRDAVKLLRKNGFNTFSSCEGGSGHAFAVPTIRVKPVDWTDMFSESCRIARSLVAAGYTGFETKCCAAYQSDVDPWQPEVYCYIEIEFWLLAED